MSPDNEDRQGNANVGESDNATSNVLQSPARGGTVQQPTVPSEGRVSNVQNFPGREGRQSDWRQHLEGGPAADVGPPQRRQTETTTTGGPQRRLGGTARMRGKTGRWNLSPGVERRRESREV